MFACSLFSHRVYTRPLPQEKWFGYEADLSEYDKPLHFTSWTELRSRIPIYFQFSLFIARLVRCTTGINMSRSSTGRRWHRATRGDADLETFWLLLQLNSHPWPYLIRRCTMIGVTLKLFVNSMSYQKGH